MNLLMISGDRDLIKGKKGPFYYLLQEFSEHWERIDIICPGDNDESQKFFNNVYLWSCASEVNNIFNKAQEIYKISQFKVMTVHDYPPFKHSQAARLISNKYKIPYMIEIHHIVGYPRAADLRERILKLYFKTFFKKAISAKAIRVVNQKQVPEFLIKLGIPKNKIKYLPSFYIDKNVFYPQNLEKKYDLLFVGRLVKNKGLDLLVRILTQLKKEMPDFRMAIVGDGPEGEKFKLRIKACPGEQGHAGEKGLINNVELLGWLPDTESLAHIYNQSKILLITSYNEGGPRVGLEAMACGTPVISTKVGIMIDLIKNNENGYLVDWQESEFISKIKEFLNNPDLDNKLSRQAAETVKGFDYQKTIKDYADCLKNLQ